MKVVNGRTGGTLGERIEQADTFLSRARGLLGRDGLGEGEGLWIEPCRSIHMFGMRFAIDVVFVTADGRVTRLHEGLRPWRTASGGAGAHAVLEVPTGTIAASGTRVGDPLERLD